MQHQPWRFPRREHRTVLLWRHRSLQCQLVVRRISALLIRCAGAPASAPASAAAVVGDSPAAAFPATAGRLIPSSVTTSVSR
jgi:hypothetical protein